MVTNKLILSLQLAFENNKMWSQIVIW